MKNILKVNDLHVSFSLFDSTLLAVRGVTFDLEKGKTLGIVGESGCGKSVTAFSLLGLVPPPGKIEKGVIEYKGKNLAVMRDDELRLIRGKEIAMIFQEPMSSLNPVLKIGYQIQESILLHTSMNKGEAKEYTYELLNKVGIPSPEKRYNSYPHEFSGGMRQRVMIAIALSASPSILIADEPTTALDVTIQAQILDLLLKLQEEQDMSLILITHDLGIVANIADSIAIMYAGEMVEYGNTDDIFKNPKHPYTIGLFDAIPKISEKADELKTIPGIVPTITSVPEGCVFYPRCFKGDSDCIKDSIELYDCGNSQAVRCIKAG